MDFYKSKCFKPWYFGMDGIWRRWKQRRWSLKLRNSWSSWKIIKFSKWFLEIKSKIVWKSSRQAKCLRKEIQRLTQRLTWSNSILTLEK